MLDKLMRLPIIPEATSYPRVNENGVLVDSGGTSGQRPIGEYLSLEEIGVLQERSRDGVAIRIDIFRRQCDILDADKSEDGWYKVRVSMQAIILDDDFLKKFDLEIPEEFQHLFMLRGHVVLAMAGVIGPSIEAITAYIKGL